MKEKLHYIVLVFLGWSIWGYSQETEVAEPIYDWVWAHNGGGDKNMGDSTIGNPGVDWRGSYNKRSLFYEQVVDIQVDADNNSYILAIIGQQNTRFGEEEVAVYNYTNRVTSDSDVLLISLDCAGRTRWMRVIGGYGSDGAYNLGLDAQGGLYVGMMIDNSRSHSAQEENPNYWVERLPPYFDENTHLPFIDAFLYNLDESSPHEVFKSLALVKYRTVDGGLEWVEYPEGLISWYRPGAIEEFSENGTPYSSNLTGTAGKVITEADGTTHWLVAFRPGSYLNGSIVVPESEEYWRYHEFYVLVYHANGSLKRSFKVPLTTNDTTWGGGILSSEDHNFWYDAVTQQYYLGGFFYWTGGSIPAPSFGGVALTGGAYVLAFNPTGNELWRITTNGNLGGGIKDLKTDTEGNIYITGLFQIRDPSLEGYFGDYQITGNTPPYVMKLAPDTGSVRWASFGTQLEAPGGGGIYTSGSAGQRLSVSANEVVLAMHLSSCNWGEFESGIPWESGRGNPFVVRFSKETGTPKGLYRIDAGTVNPSGAQAVAVDRDGNIIVGGFHTDPLFTGHAVVPPLEVQGHGFADFFVAKLATTECGTAVVFPDEVLGTAKAQQRQAIFYPNPTTDRVYWESEVVWKYVEVYDVLGKTVLKETVQEASIGLGHLPAGTYVLALFDYNGNKTIEKVILRK